MISLWKMAELLYQRLLALIQQNQTVRHVRLQRFNPQEFVRYRFDRPRRDRYSTRCA